MYSHTTKSLHVIILYYLRLLLFFFSSRRRHTRCGRDWSSDVCFFFFQAEDGIRDADVTGVQTCALPIFPEGDDDVAFDALGPRRLRRGQLTGGDAIGPVREELVGAWRVEQIGRASCRERV